MNKPLFVLLVFSAQLFFQPTGLAWNNYGHMSVACVAYRKLDTQTRAKVDGLLSRNPDFANWQALIPAGTAAADQNMILFMIAATWADRIKSAPGFTEDDPADRNKCGPLSGQNIGFSDHLRHRCWHFIDVAFTQDGTSPLPSTPVPNAQERADKFRPVLGGNDEDLKAYDLCWLLHLIGDLHQPLHCTMRVGQSQPNGDAGGNLVQLQDGSHAPVKLHAFWDDLLGELDSKPTAKALQKLIKAAKRLKAADPTKASDLNTGHWVDEGMLHARSVVYVSPVGLGAGPFPLTKKYKKNARALARKQVSLAGARLSKLLNDELK